METEFNTQQPQFSVETLKELEENRRKAQEQFKHHKREAKRCGQLVDHYNAILGVSQNGPESGEKADGSQNEYALSPTKFVLKLLTESSDRWISIDELLYKSRSAFESGEVVNRSGKIDTSIHSVLTRYRKIGRVWTKGRRETRKYKLK